MQHAVSILARAKQVQYQLLSDKVRADDDVLLFSFCDAAEWRDIEFVRLVDG